MPTLAQPATLLLWYSQNNYWRPGYYSIYHNAANTFFVHLDNNRIIFHFSAIKEHFQTTRPVQIYGKTCDLHQAVWIDRWRWLFSMKLFRRLWIMMTLGFAKEKISDSEKILPNLDPRSWESFCPGPISQGKPSLCEVSPTVLVCLKIKRIEKQFIMKST